MFISAILFGVGVLLVLGMTAGTARARGNLDAVLMGIMFVGTWAAGKLIGYGIGAWQNLELYPAVDALVAFFVITLYIERQERWKLALLWVLFSKEMVHVYFWVSAGRRAGPYELGTYMTALDMLFSVEVGCVAWGAFSNGPGAFGRVMPRARRRRALVVASGRGRDKTGP